MPETEESRTPEAEVTEDFGKGDIGRSDEPSMYVERPSSARSQDVTHILVRTFREIFTRDTIAPDTIQYLETSKCSDDEHHQQYVDALLKVVVTEFYDLKIVIHRSPLCVNHSGTCGLVTVVQVEEA